MYRIGPLQDPRWAEFVDRHPHSSAFHTARWLKAVQRTYGYEPIALLTSPPGAVLENAIVFSCVSVWPTGFRMVSLPYSDHCQPLVEDETALNSLLLSLKHDQEGCKYIEIRPRSWPSKVPQSDLPLYPGHSYAFHILNLKSDLDALFRGFHGSCIQRKIRRAEREKLTYEEGRSAYLLDQFYKLLVGTRRRHGLPPQPLRWFQNLIECLGDTLSIRLASKNGLPIASILTLTHKQTITYKYGCSDERFHNLGGMPFLFWETIQRAKQVGFTKLDLGRSDLDNPGLIQFKDHLGAERSTLTYYRYPAPRPASALRTRVTKAARTALSHTPDWGLRAIGNLVYKHLA